MSREVEAPSAALELDPAARRGSLEFGAGGGVGEGSAALGGRGVDLPSLMDRRASCV